MKTYTKRGMELIIVLTVCLLALSTWHERRVAFQQREQSLELATLLNQTLWDKYGPGTKQGYMDLFAADPYTSISLGTGRSRVISVFEELNQVELLVGNAGAILAVPEAPEWYQSRLNRAEEWAVQVPPVLEKGPYLAAPDEIYFATSEYHSLWISGIAQKALGLKQLALRDWIQGNKDQAIVRLGDIIRLGDAFRYSPVAWEHLMRAMVIEIGLDGFDTVLWTNPGPEEDRKILSALQQFKPEEWRIPRYVENILWLSYADYVSVFNQYKPDMIAAALLLNGLPEPQRDTRIDDLYHEIGLIPDWRYEKLRAIPQALVSCNECYERFFKQRDSRKTAALLEKWTTLPAMRKRAGNLPDWFYESDPLLSVENARRFPPLVYAASRFATLFADNYYQTNMVMRLIVARQKMEALTAAFWARCQRDTNGAWPTNDDLDDQFKTQTDLSWYSDIHNQWFLKSYIARHQTPKRFYMDEGKIQVNPGDNSEIIFPMKWYGYETISRAEIPSVTATRVELERWVNGIFQQDPLVESITPIYMKDQFNPDQSVQVVHFYQVKLNLPKTKYWVTKPGPDGWPDGFILRYDPSNGTQSRGDILQLAGWE